MNPFDSDLYKMIFSQQWSSENLYGLVEHRMRRITTNFVTKYILYGHFQQIVRRRESLSTYITQWSRNLSIENLAIK